MSACSARVEAPCGRRGSVRDPSACRGRMRSVSRRRWRNRRRGTPRGDHLSHAAHRLFSSAPLEATEVPHEVFFELGRRGAGGRLLGKSCAQNALLMTVRSRSMRLAVCRHTRTPGGVHQEECFGVVGAVGRDGGFVKGPTGRVGACRRRCRPGRGSTPREGCETERDKRQPGTPRPPYSSWRRPTGRDRR